MLIFITIEGAFRVVRKEREKIEKTDTKHNKPEIFNALYMIDNDINTHRCRNCDYGMLVHKWVTGATCPNCGSAENIIPKL